MYAVQIHKFIVRPGFRCGEWLPGVMWKIMLIFETIMQSVNETFSVQSPGDTEVAQWDIFL